MHDIVITQVAFDDAMLILGWADGLVLRQPLTRFSALKDADAQARQDFQIQAGGAQLCWPHLGAEGLTIDSVDWIWEHLCNDAMGRLKDLEWQLDRLGPRDQAIVALWRLEADGYNGGFVQFFCNWGEQTCQLALQALHAIGAENTRALVSRQRQLLDHLEHHPELKALWDIARLLTEEEDEVISVQLDPQLWTAMEEVPALAVRHFYPG
jgi:hypothetical protein